MADLGVAFDVVIHADGTIEHLRPPAPAAEEVAETLMADQRRARIAQGFDGRRVTTSTAAWAIIEEDPDSILARDYFAQFERPVAWVERGIWR